MIKHLAVSLTECDGTEAINALVKYAIDSQIPILTIYLSKLENPLPEVIDRHEKIFSQINTDFLDKNQVKISFLGKWYSQPEKLVEKMKHLIDVTKGYDKHFLNFCVNYDGQQEIVDAIKLINMQISSGKASPENIDKSFVKENIYSSYFLPPDIIVFTEKKLNSFLLWDSPNSKVFFYDGNPDKLVVWLRTVL